MPFFKLNDVFAGRYVLVELIGEGSSSEVWKAKNQLADEIAVVLRIYVPQKDQDDQAIRQVRQDFSLRQQLYHPHLLKAYHFDIWEGYPYLIMPFSPKGSLTSLLKEKGSLSEKQLALIMSQVGSALAALHRQEPPILHQDVKPENIVISQPDYFMLADFGISSRGRHPLPASAPASKSVMEAYAPPERFDPYQKADASGDIFSFGVTLFELCTKTIPWDGAGSQKLLTGGSVPKLPDEYSAELNKLLQACLSTSRRERPTTAELQLRGENFLETGSWSLSDKKEEEEDSIFSKRPLPYFLAAAIFILLLLAGYWAFMNNQLPFGQQNLQQKATSINQDQDVNEMLIAMLEEELAEKTRHALELEEENRQLKDKQPGNSILMKSRDSAIAVKQEQATAKVPESRIEEKQEQLNKEPEAVAEVKKEKPARQAPEPGIEENGVLAAQQAQASTEKPETMTRMASGPAAPPKKENWLLIQKKLEKQLNKVADPYLSMEERTAWKQETMAHFSEKGVQIVDETTGTPKHYSTAIFLNLLSRVPHTIVVNEVKRDQHKKVTELRLTMESDN